MLIILFTLFTTANSQYRPLGCDVNATKVEDFDDFLDHLTERPAYSTRTKIFNSRIFQSFTTTNAFDPPFKTCTGRNLTCQYYYKRYPKSFQFNADKSNRTVTNNTIENCKFYNGIIKGDKCIWSKSMFGRVYNYTLPLNDYIMINHINNDYMLSVYVPPAKGRLDMFYYLGYITKVVIPCPCKYLCTVLIQALPRVVIVDGRIIHSDYSVKQLVNVDAAINSHHNTTPHAYIQIAERRPDYPEKALVPYDFRAKIFLYVQGQFGPETHRRIYCVKPLINRVACNPNIREGLLINSQGQISAVQDSKRHPDPQFVAPDITRLPTSGSCKTIGGYKFVGNYTPADEDPDYCRTPSSRDSCLSNKLEPAIHVLTVPKRLYGPEIRCEQLCVDPLNCLHSEKSSPLWGACGSLVQRYSQVVYVQYQDKDEVIKAFNITHLHQVDIKAVQFLMTSSLSTKVKLEDKVSKFVDYFKGWSTNVKYPVPEHGIAQQMLLFIDLAYNNEHDMNTVAALPWLAGWRYGTQLNALTYAMSTVFNSLEVLAAEINQNNIHITNAITTINEQVTNNYNSIVSVYSALKGSILQLASDLRQLSEQVYTIEYITAKLAQIQAQVAQAERELNKIELDMRLLKLQHSACNDKLSACLPGPGVYLSHYLIDSDVATSLIVHYLKPQRCRYTEVTGFKCKDGNTHVASYGCQYQDDVLTSWLNTTCNETIIPKCGHLPKHLQMFQLNQFITPVSKRRFNYTYHQFNSTIEDIYNYKQAVVNAIDKVSLVKGVTLADNAPGLGLSFMRTWYQLDFWQMLAVIIGAGLIVFMMFKTLLNRCTR